MSRIFRTGFVILVPLLGLVAIGFTVVTGDRWVHARTQEIVARQLADTMQREVRVGRVDGNLLTGVSVDGVSVAGDGPASGRTVISAKRLQLSYNLRAMLTNTSAAAAQVSEVRVYGLEMDLKRYANGRLNVEELFPPSEKTVPPEQQFHGKVLLKDAIVHYEDQTADFAQPLKIDCLLSDGTVDMGRPDLVIAHLTAQSGGREFEGIELGLHLDRTTGEYSIDADVADLDLHWADQHFVRDASINVLGGYADARASVYHLKHGDRAETGYCIHGNIAPTEVALRTLDGPLHIDGPVTVTPQGITTEGLDVAWHGGSIQTTGSVLFTDETTLDLAVNAQDLDVKRLLALVPAEQLKDIPDFAVGGPMNLEATVTGPVNLASVDARLEAPEWFSVSRDNADARGRRLAVAISLMDTSKPAAIGKITVGELESGSIELAAGEPAQWPKRAGVSTLRDVAIDAKWAGGSPLVHTQIVADTIDLDGLELTDVRADATLAGTALHVHDLSAETLGASLTGTALADLSGTRPDVYADGVLAGLDLGRLEELPAELVRLKKTPGGSVDASFAAKYVGGEVSAAATVSGENLAYEPWGPARLGAVATYDGNDVDVLTAFVADPLGTVWAKGVLNDVASKDTGTLEMTFRIAEARVDEICGRFDIDGAKGALYALGTADGAISNPHFDAETMLFAPAYEKYRADVIAARLNGDRDNLTVEELILGRGSAAVSLAGAVSNLSALASVENGGDGGASTQISGSFSAGGIQLADVMDLVGDDVSGEVDGLAEASGSFGGTVKEPTAEGTLKVAHALTRTAQITEGTLPFSFAENVLTVEDAAFQVQGAELRANASIDFTEKPYLRAALSAADVYLEGVPQLRKLGLETAGLLQIPVAKVEGPFDALTGHASLVCEDARVGHEPVTDLRAEVTLDADTVRLGDMHCSVAGGNISGSGFYRLKEKQLEADFALTDTSVASLLDLADPISVAATRGMPTRKRNDFRQRLSSLSMRLDGTLLASAHVEGTGSNIKTSAKVGLNAAKFDGVDLPEVQVSALVDPDGVYDLNLEATQGDGLVTAQGTLEFDGEVEMLVEGSGIGLNSYQQWLPANTNLTGEMGFTVVASGQSAKPHLMGSVDVFEPGVAGIGFDLLTAPIVSLEEGKLDIDTLTLKKGEEEVVVDGMLPFSWEIGGIADDKPMQFTARIEETDLGLLPVLLNEHAQFQARRDGKEASKFFDGVLASGSVNSTVTVSGTPAEPKVTGSLQIADGSFAMNEKSKAIRDIGLEVGFDARGAGNIVSLKKAEAVWDDTRVALSGDIDVRSSAVGQLSKNVYDLTMNMKSAKQEIMSGLVVQDMDSEIRLTGGGASTPKLTVSNVGGKFGQGSILLNGSADLRDFRVDQLALNKVDMQLVADQAAVAAKGLLEGLVDGTVLIRGAGKGKPADVKGSWVISHGRLGIPPTSAGESKPLLALSSSFPNPNLDLRIGFGPDMSLVAAGLVAPLQPTTSAVHVLQTPQNPQISGVILAREGRTQMPGGIATIEKMSVKYKLSAAPGQYGQDPVELVLSGEVSGIAETVIESASLNGRDIGQVTVRIALVGQLPDQWDLKVSSSPPMDEDQIYAMLGGAPLGYLTGGDSGPQDIQQMVSQQFLSALAAGFRMKVFAPIEQSLKRALGLSELSLNFTFNQPVEIRVGKYLMEDLLVSYRTAFGSEDGGEYDLSVSYEVGNQLRVSYSTDEGSRDTMALEKVWEF